MVGAEDQAGVVVDVLQRVQPGLHLQVRRGGEGRKSQGQEVNVSKEG